MLTSHLRDHGMKVGLVLVVDEPIVEDTLTLVTEQTEDLGLISHCSWLTLQHTCTETPTHTHAEADNEYDFL